MIFTSADNLMRSPSTAQLRSPPRKKSTGKPSDSGSLPPCLLGERSEPKTDRCAAFCRVAASRRLFGGSGVIARPTPRTPDQKRAGPPLRCGPPLKAAVAISSNDFQWPTRKSELERATSREIELSTRPRAPLSGINGRLQLNQLDPQRSGQAAQRVPRSGRIPRLDSRDRALRHDGSVGELRLRPAPRLPIRRQSFADGFQFEPSLVQ